MSVSAGIGFDTYGSGPKNILLIHGYCETRRMWDSFIPLLSECFDTHKIYTIDLPGFGESPLSDETQSISDVADQVLEFCQKEKITSTVVIGHSLGGYVIMQLIAKRPELFEGLCFFHSSIFADSEEKKLTRNKTMDFINSNGKEVFIKNFIPSLFHPDNKDRLEMEIKNSIELGHTVSTDSMIKYMQMMRDRMDLSNILKETEVPVHFIIGAEDQSVPLDISKRQLSYPLKSSGLILQHCAHMGMFEKPYESSASVLSFLNSKK